MRDYQQILRDYFADPLAKPMRPKELAQELGLGKNDFKRFKDAIEGLVADGRLMMGKNKLVRSAAPVDTIAGTVKRTGRGNGFFQPHDPLALEPGESLYISPEDLKDAYTGDEVLVQLLRTRMKGQRCGRVVEVVSRGSQAFVGTYFERRDHGFVRIDGNQFDGPISVGDPGAKGVIPEDRVVVEMLRFPSNSDAGEAVITKVLGARGAPGVDLQTIIAEFDLPDEFPEAVLAEARLQAQMFEEEEATVRRGSPDPAETDDRRSPLTSSSNQSTEDREEETCGQDGVRGQETRAQQAPPHSRLDLTNDLIITIDPIDARDFDDAISLTHEDDGNWRLGVHIADVAHFVRSGTLLDKEAHRRGTSVYLPDKVLPMLPEVISNALASLQAGRVRYTKSVFITFSPEGVPLHSEFANSKINVAQRFAYEQVMPLVRRVEGRVLSAGVGGDGTMAVPSTPQSRGEGTGIEVEIAPSVLSLLRDMHSLAMTLRKRRFAHGSLDLNLPEVKIDMTRDGTVAGAHRQPHDESHQIIEEFMLAANIAVATKLTDLGIPFLRRNHAAPDEMKLRILGEFAKSLDYKTKPLPGRADLQKLLHDVQGTPHEYAISFATLRSMKQAVYSPDDKIGHYALAFENYCHFTSPIRRYPDLAVHRLMDAVIRQEAESSEDSSSHGVVSAVPSARPVFGIEHGGERATVGGFDDAVAFDSNDADGAERLVVRSHAERGGVNVPELRVRDDKPHGKKKKQKASHLLPARPGRGDRRAASDSLPEPPRFPVELVLLGKWCSMTERRAQDAERELIKLKMLEYLTQHIGEEMHASITGVEKFGLFCTGIELPAEGLVHISTLGDDRYDYDDRSHTLVGRRSNRTYRLGDFVKVTVAKVDLVERKLEMRLVIEGAGKPGEERPLGERSHARRERTYSSKPFPPKRHRRGR